MAVHEADPFSRGRKRDEKRGGRLRVKHFSKRRLPSAGIITDAVAPSVIPDPGRIEPLEMTPVKMQSELKRSAMHAVSPRRNKSSQIFMSDRRESAAF